MLKWLFFVSLLSVAAQLTGCCSHNPAKYDEAELRIHAAAIEGHADCFKKYLVEETNINARNKYGETCVHLATKNGRPEVISLLVEQKADLDVVGESRNSALHYCMKPGAVYRSMATALLNAEADPNKINSLLQSPLHLTNRPDLIKELLNAGAEPYFEDREGYTPVLRNMLDTSTGVSDMEYIDLYLSNGLDPNHIYPVIDQGLLHWAIEKDRKDIFDRVMAANPDLELADRAGRPPLYVAMELRRAKLANALLKGGASANGRRIFKGNPDMYETMLNGAVRRLDIYNTILLLKFGAKADSMGFSPDGSTPLYNLCRVKVVPAQIKSQLEVFQTLIDAGANPNTPIALGDGSFPLHAAVGQKNTSLVAKLLDLGASVNAKNRKEQTPLHLAAATGDMKLIQRLLAGGASKLIVDNKRRTPGRVAFEAGFIEVASALDYAPE